jgi:hypothetical protein
MTALAEQERFEEAGLARDRLRALAEALERARRDRWLLAPGELRLRDASGTPIRIRGGALVRSGDEEPVGAPPARERADEVAALRGFVARHAIRVDHADVPPCEPVEGGAELHRLLTLLRARERDAGRRRRDG